MKRIARFAVVALMASSVSAMAMNPRVAGHSVEGYLDRAPTGSEIVERVVVRSGDAKRTLLVVKRIETGSGSVSSGGDDLAGSAVPLELRGTTEQVSRVMSSPVGTHVLGFFVRSRSYPVLILGDVAFEAPDQAVAMPATEG